MFEKIPQWASMEALPRVCVLQAGKSSKHQGYQAEDSLVMIKKLFTGLARWIRMVISAIGGDSRVENTL